MLKMSKTFLVGSSVYFQNSHAISINKLRTCRNLTTLSSSHDANHKLLHEYYYTNNKDFLFHEKENRITVKKNRFKRKRTYWKSLGFFL